MAWDDATAQQLAGEVEADIVVRAPGRPDVRTPIWVVAVDGDLFVRSWKGTGGLWYRRALRAGAGSLVDAGGRVHPVRFTAAGDPGLNDRVDEAYRAKYGASTYSKAMTEPPATETTMRVDPA
ncbi:DUF2255 family protein [Actinoplanes sp. DH11]|uniref:DUF2255 family protein n=1 Tax=Actinoplanes sp. DH11 TaxID=2857011 RepID=UPI001E4D27C2|nr:DUF2255 family protein [Actinoplanes sp. DH11]